MWDCSERARNGIPETLNGIAAEAKRMGNLVENMLLLARVDAGEWPVNRSRVFLDDVLLDAASAARALGSSKGVDVEVAALEETPINGDPGAAAAAVHDSAGQCSQLHAGWRQRHGIGATQRRWLQGDYRR